MKAAFTEEMIGFYTPGAPAYDTGYVTGQRDRRSLMFRLTVGTDDLTGMLDDPNHRMAARGFVRCPELGSGTCPSSAAPSISSRRGGSPDASRCATGSPSTATEAR